MGCKGSKGSKGKPLTFTEENLQFIETLKEYSQYHATIFNIMRNSEYRVFIGYVHFDGKYGMEFYHKRIQLESVEKCDDDCPICLEPLDKDVVKLSLCRHCFHRKCIKQHFKANGESCPMCRAKPFIPEHVIEKMNPVDSSSEESYDDY